MSVVASPADRGDRAGAPPAEGGPAEPVPLPIRIDFRSIALTGIFLLATVYTLHFAQAFLVPVVLALLLEFLFGPLVRALRRARIPEKVGAALVILGLVGTLGLGAYWLSAPATDWVSRAPQSLRKIEMGLKRLRKPMEEMSRTAEQVEKTITMDDGSPGLELKGPSLMSILFGGTQRFLTSLAVVIVLLYFLLATGDLFLGKAVKMLSSLHDKKRVVEIARETERQISAFLFTSVLINIGLGVAVAIGMRLAGMPNPGLWGVLAAFLNFIPYLGPLVCTAVLALASFLTFDDVWRALLPPAIYYTLHFVESNVVTPMVLGRTLTLNPVVVFVGVMFWTWIWGTLGGMLAVPILVIVKIVCDRIEGLTPVGEFLGP